MLLEVSNKLYFSCIIALFKVLVTIILGCGPYPHLIFFSGKLLAIMKIEKLSWKDTIFIRHKVLWPNENPRYCIVKGDEEALHFGVSLDGKVVCVASVYLDNKSARLRKFATLNEYQGNGVGTFMLKYLIGELKVCGVEYLWFDARESAVEFYKSSGFGVFGERFYKKDVPYFKMDADL